MGDCPVCLSEYTKKVRIEKTCTYCGQGACLTCLKRYVLGSMSDPHCLHCRRAYSSEIIDALFTKHFRKTELRKHRILVLMDQERSLFPQTLGIIEREDAQSAYVRAYSQHQDLILRLSPRDTAPLDPDLVVQINQIREVILRLLRRVTELGVELTPSSTAVQRREFVKKCPNCPDGFLSTAWRCALCKTRVCSHCLAVKGVGIVDGDPDPTHECKAEDVASARTIQEETKPCPHCGVRVQRSEGCSQMWCTACNNAFDWRTGQKVNGPVHNPHFHEFQRSGVALQQPQAQNWQNACENNRDPTMWPWIYGHHIINQLQQRGGVPANWQTRILDMNRFMIERSVVARAYRPYGPTSYEDLRKRRLRRQIDDAAWAKLLSSRETRREKENRMRLLDELILAVGRDTIGALLQRTHVRPNEFESQLGQPMEAAREYFNHQLESMASEAEIPRQRIDERWFLRVIQ